MDSTLGRRNPALVTEIRRPVVQIKSLDTHKSWWLNPSCYRADLCTTFLAGKILFFLLMDLYSDHSFGGQNDATTEDVFGVTVGLIANLCYQNFIFQEKVSPARSPSSVPSVYSDAIRHSHQPFRLKRLRQSWDPYTDLGQIKVNHFDATSLCFHSTLHRRVPQTQYAKLRRVRRPNGSKASIPPLICCGRYLQTR
jgi:hypothetical protein